MTESDGCQTQTLPVKIICTYGLHFSLLAFIFFKLFHYKGGQYRDEKMEVLVNSCTKKLDSARMGEDTGKFLP